VDRAFDEMNAPILSGLRVIELGAFVAGPFGGVTLASLGADVIRIDPPGGGPDINRGPRHNGRSLYWAGINQGKRSAAIDTRSEKGKSQVARLIAAPGDGGGIVLTNLHIAGWNSYEELRKLRHDLIMVVITGRHDGASAVDYTVNAGLGFPWITGPDELTGPVNHVLPAFDLMTGLWAALAILAADRRRRLTGEGQFVEIALEDVAIAAAGHLGYLAEAILNREPRGRHGNDVYGTFGHEFATSDGRRVMVLGLTPRQWHSLVEATGVMGEVAALEARLNLDLRDEDHRWRARKEISALLEPWFAARTLAAVGLKLEAHGVLWGPYRSFQQFVAEDARLATPNPMFARVEHSGIGTFATVGSPVRFSGASPVPPLPAPALGEHTEQVLHELETEASQ
jgi:2-methylfumaryl-CoA isomerase